MFWDTNMAAVTSCEKGSFENEAFEKEDRSTKHEAHHIIASKKPSRWLPRFNWMSLTKWLNNNWFIEDLVSVYCLTTSNQKEAMSGTVSGLHVWILLGILTVQKLCDFNFLRGLAPGLLDGFSIERYEEKRESFDLFAASLKAEWCDFQVFGNIIAPALEPFQKNDSSLVRLLLGKVNGKLKILQNRSKNRFWGERTTIYHR